MNTSTPRHPSKSEIQATLAGIRGVLEQYRIVSKPGSSLAEACSEAEWLLGFPGEIFDDTGARGADRERFLSAFLVFVHLTRLHNGFVACRDKPGFRAVLKHVAGVSVSIVGPDEEGAWDHFFELEMAGGLGGSLWVVSFDERPDLILTDTKGDRFAIACKRPRRLSTVAAAVDRGIEQVRGSDSVGGAVAVSLDLAIPTRLKPVGMTSFATQASFGTTCDGILHAAVEELRPSIETLLQTDLERSSARSDLRPVIGVDLSASFVGASGDPSALCWQRSFVQVVNPGLPDAEGLLALLRQSSEVQERLRTRQQEAR